MKPTIAVIAPGAMGSGVARRLADHGASVPTLLEGRSAATVARARAAGMQAADEATIAAADIILSIVPPGEAKALAERLAPALRAVASKPV
jgi:putative dehydrogenase